STVVFRFSMIACMESSSVPWKDCETIPFQQAKSRHVFDKRTMSLSTIVLAKHTSATQFTPQDFADIGFGQLGSELDLSRTLVVGHIFSAESLEFFRCQVWILFHHEQLYSLSRTLIRYTNNCAFQNA